METQWWAIHVSFLVSLASESFSLECMILHLTTLESIGGDYGVWKEKYNIVLNKNYTLDRTQWLNPMDEYNLGVWLAEPL